MKVAGGFVIVSIVIVIFVIVSIEKKILFLFRSPSPTRPTGPKKRTPYARNRLSYNGDELDERSPNNDSSGKIINI